MYTYKRRKPVNYFDKSLTSKDEFTLNDSTFRRIPGFARYYVSDRGEVMSTHGKLKLLHGHQRSKDCHMFILVDNTGKARCKTDNSLCAMAFGDAE